MSLRSDIEFIVKFHGDQWVTVELANGTVIAIDSQARKVFRVPDPHCPFVIFPSLTSNDQ